MEPRVRPAEVLVVEDNPGDTRLLAECLRTLSFPYTLRSVTDGDAALAFLQQQAPYPAASTPEVILLDIHSFKRSGWEVLEWLRTQPALASIPVVMWGGTLSLFNEQARDRLHPTQCLVKPTSVKEYQRLVELIDQLLRQQPPDG